MTKVLYVSSRLSCCRLLPAERRRDRLRNHVSRRIPFEGDRGAMIRDGTTDINENVVASFWAESPSPSVET